MNSFVKIRVNSRTKMNITRVYTDGNGDSQFDEVEFELHSQGQIGSLSEWQLVTKLAFRETGADYDYDWHCAPRRQFIVMLDGHIEIETSLGEKREFKGGDVLLVEDTSGKGHRTHELSGRTRRSIFVALD